MVAANDHALTGAAIASPDKAAQPLVFNLEEVLKRRAAAGSIFELRIPRLKIRAGDRLALVGPSGSGKSTLLDLLALILRPDRSRLFTLATANGIVADVADIWARRGSGDALAALRRRRLGYVLQEGGLLPFLTVKDNILLPRRLLGLPEDRRVETIIATLGLERHLAKRPPQLSVGERQRVAVARALAHGPSIVLADEPTASLDPLTGERVLDLLANLLDGGDTALVVATHDRVLAERMGLRPLLIAVSGSSRATVVAELEAP